MIVMYYETVIDILHYDEPFHGFQMHDFARHKKIDMNGTSRLLIELLGI